MAGGVITSVAPVKQGPEVWLAPGLVDLQVNGYGGHDVNSGSVGPQDIAAMVEALWRRGTTTLCPTIITGPAERMTESLHAVARARAEDALVAHSVPCAHVEGPAISSEDGPRGAHPLEHVRGPDLGELDRWQEASGDLVGIVTLAPERPGAFAYISELNRRGIVAAIGHTAATPAQVRQAADAGARLSTHLGNGSHAQLPRLDNYLWEQLADDRLWASFIFDGHHLPPAAMRAMVRAKGMRRSLLVSDSVALAGSPPGLYRAPVGGTVRLHPDGKLVMEGTGFLAGSASDLLTGVANAVRLVGLGPADALSLASTNPAQLLGLGGPGGRGRLTVGHRADVAVLSWPPGAPAPTPVATVVAGRLVHADPRNEEVAQACEP